MRAFSIVGEEEFVQCPLHLVDGLEPGTTFLDAEVFIKEGYDGIAPQYRWIRVGLPSWCGG